jgi:hypothetical protein
MVKQAKKRASAMAAEEKVSLIGKDGEAAPAPSLRPHRSQKLGLVESLMKAWTLPRLMKYMALCAATAVLTFFMLRREQQAVLWEQYHSLLEPEPKEQRCYVSSRDVIRNNVCFEYLERVETICMDVWYWSVTTATMSFFFVIL